MAHPFAQEVVEDLMRAKDRLGEAKACFDSEEYERGIGLAEGVARSVTGEIVPRAHEAEQEWNELFHRADDVSAQIQSMDIPFALKAAPEKVEALLRGERDMVGSLCERSRENLAEAIEACERLAQEIRDAVIPLQERLRAAESMVVDVDGLLASASTSGIHEQVAPAFEEARRLLENARDFVGRGDAGAALDDASAAQAKLQREVIECQEAARGKLAGTISRAVELLGKIEVVCSSDAAHYCPDAVSGLRAHASDVLLALAAQDPERMEMCIGPAEDVIESVMASLDAAKAKSHMWLSQELAEIDEAIQKAVQRCAGSYSPDMLEEAYLDLNRINEQVGGGPETLTAELERALARDLAVARTKVEQVELLRERFEREKRENLDQLRLKMDSAREAIEVCSKLDFVDEGSPEVRKGREMLEQADGLLVEGDLEESFELVRQSLAVAERLRVEAGEGEREWKGLAERLTSDEAAHRALLSDLQAEKVAGEEHRKLSELARQTQSVIDAKDLGALKEHADALGALSEEVIARLEELDRESRGVMERQIGEAAREIRLAELLGAGNTCPDVIGAARSYEGIAEKYLAKGDSVRAEAAARDALAKARDAGTLARAAVERAAALALDYMKIAADHIAQHSPEAAGQALEEGLTLAEKARARRREPPQPEA